MANVAQWVTYVTDFIQIVNTVQMNIIYAVTDIKSQKSAVATRWS